MVTNRVGNRNFMQPMGRLSMHSKCLDFFSFKFGGGGVCVCVCVEGAGFLFIFPLSPNFCPGY
jgi:hypothetical protein